MIVCTSTSAFSWLQMFRCPLDYVGPMPSYHYVYLQTHPWRFVDGATGKTLQEWTASTGEQTVSLTNDNPSPLPETSTSAPSMQLAGGFDGLGGDETAYCAATVSQHPCIDNSIAPQAVRCSWAVPVILHNR